MSATPPPPPPAPEPDSNGPRGPLLAVLAVVVVAVLVVPVALAALHAVGGGDDASDGTARATPPVSADASSAASAGSTSARPSSRPSRTRSASPSATASPTPDPAAVTCWNGARAAKVAACSEPEGATGLAWVFPSIRGQRCGKPTDAGAGVVIRQVCRAQVAGGRALIVYAQFGSTADAAAYLSSKGLAAAAGADASDGVVAYQGGAKVGAAYAEEAFAYVLTLPAGADPAAATRQVVDARPAGQVRGVRSR